MFVEVESHLTSVERLSFFSKSVPHEASVLSESTNTFFFFGVILFKPLSSLYDRGGECLCRLAAWRDPLQKGPTFNILDHSELKLSCGSSKGLCGVFCWRSERS